MPPARDPYLVKSLVHANTVLRAFRSTEEIIGLAEVARRSGLDKPRCFRMLYTLVHCGLLRKAGKNQYRLPVLLKQPEKYRIGYCAQETRSQFSKDLLDGLKNAAELAGDIELLILDNRLDPRRA